MRVNRFWKLLFVVALAVPGQPDQPAGIDGFVMIDMAAAGSGATVGVDNLAKGFHRETTTNTSGYYLVDELEPGSYSIWGEIRGLGCIIYPHVAVFPGERVRKDFHFARAKRSPGNCEPLANKSK